MMTGILNIQKDIEHASAHGSGLLTEADFDLFLSVDPNELVQTFTGCSIQAKKDIEIIGLQEKLVTEEKAMKEPKKKLVDSESSSKSLRTFHDGWLVLVEVEAKVAKLADFMFDTEEEPKQTDGEATVALGRLVITKLVDGLMISLDIKEI
ncbi:hypothetical protein TIFTF001_016684 [Ficus carica]|uniref:Uncharacterized protein n=1 Tax=Ficus carica TaxID=3494 RepID=A0AA88A870_FICCA|nr:hypothetical protein TIFTF001_016684 [Ficus carica]